MVVKEQPVLEPRRRVVGLDSVWYVFGKYSSSSSFCFAQPMLRHVQMVKFKSMHDTGHGIF